MREEDAARRLVDAYADLILRVSYTYLHSTHDAEDVCQEVLIKLLRQRGQDASAFESSEHERAWVVRVAANQCKDLLRRRASRETVPLDEVAEPEAPEPLDETAARARADGVLAQVMRLPLMYREAIYLHYYEGYSVRELARATGVSEAAAARRLSRARSKLREAMGEEGCHDGGRDF